MSFDYNNTYDWRHTYKWQQLCKQVLARDNGYCMIQGPKCKGIATQVDHRIAVDDAARAGLTPMETNSLMNLRAACVTCNASLGSRLRNRKHAKAYTVDMTKPIVDFDPMNFDPRRYGPDEFTPRGFNPSTYDASTGKDSKGFTPEGNYYNPKYFG